MKWFKKYLPIIATVVIVLGIIAAIIYTISMSGYSY